MRGKCCYLKFFPRIPVLPRDVLPVIHAGALEFPVIETETERADQVECRACGCTEACHVAGVGWNLRLDENDVHQSWHGGASVPLAALAHVERPQPGRLRHHKL